MLEKIKEFIQKPIGIAVSGFLVGLFFGLVVLGWWLWPVRWYDAGLPDLHEDLRVQVMEQAVNAFAETADEDAAIQMYLGFGAKAADTYLLMRENDEIAAANLAKFDQLLESTGNLPKGVDIVVEEQQQQPADVTEEQPSVADEGISEEISVINEEIEPVSDNRALRTIGTLLGIFLIFLVLGGVVLIYLFFIRGNKNPFSKPGRDREQVRDRSPMPQTAQDYDGDMIIFDDEFEEDVYDETIQASSDEFFHQEPARKPRVAPIQRSVTYVHSDTGINDLDTQYALKALEDPSRTVMEYGVSMSNSHTVNGVKYALAFDIFMFSHPEQKQKTRVLITKDQFKKPEALQMYEGKGEPVAIQDFNVFTLETQQYRLNGSIIEAIYSVDQSTGETYLQQMTIDLVAHYL
jgi:hypothetical protein